MATLWKKLTVKVSAIFSPERRKKAAAFAAAAITKGRTGLEVNYIDRTEAEIGEKLSSATAKLIESLRYVDEAAIRVGPVLVIKAKVNGVIRLAAVTISTEVRKDLDNNPQMMLFPDRVLEFLKEARERESSIALQQRPSIPLEASKELEFESEITPPAAGLS